MKKPLPEGLVFPLLLLAITFLPAQEPREQNAQQAQRKVIEQQQFRLAQNYQRRNEHGNAVQILRVLYTGNPGNVQYYQELLESQLQLGQIEESLQLIVTQKQNGSVDPRYDVDYGNVLFKADRREEALQMWEKTLDEHPDNVALYTMVANKMLVNRLYDEATELYKKAYKKHPDKSFLLRDIAEFYRRRLDYEQAISWYLRYVKAEPRNYEVAMRQTLAFNVEPEEIVKVVSYMREAMRHYNGVPEAQMIAARFYQKYRRYDDALEIYRKLEDKQSNGRYLIEFGRAAEVDSLYDKALAAFEEAIRRFPESSLLLPAYLGAARSFLELARTENNQSYARKSLEMIAGVRSKYPRNPQLPELILLEGEIHREFFFDIDRAISVYEDLAADLQVKEELRERALLKAGECYIIRGDLNQAGQTFRLVRHMDNLPEALMQQARIAFYRTEYSLAAEKIDSVLLQEGFSGRIVNDALHLQMLLANASESPQALQAYAEVDQLLFSRRKSEALGKLHKALELPASAGFQIQMLLQAGKMAADLGKSAEALEYGNRILQNKEFLLYADQALFLMATVVEQQLKDLPAAYKLYDQLLADFPNSQFIIIARDRIKRLREQNPDIVQ